MLKKCEMILMCLLTAAPCAHAATYEIDPVHSSVTFKIRHMVGTVRGGFADFAGTIDYDENTPEASAVKAAIKTASIDTRSAKRDDHLRTADFFDAAKYPEIMFISKKADPASKKLIGDLTLHGVTKEVMIDYEIGGLAEGKGGKRHLGGSGEVKFNRAEFGINYDPTGTMIGHDVTVYLDIEAVEKK